MKKEDIDITDLWRILVGQVPAEFMIEVVLRTAFVFIILIGSMRLLGKRMAGQLNKNEMIALSTLAAAVGVTLQAPDRGLIPAVIIALLVVFIGRFTQRWAFKSQRFETLSQDQTAILVEDAVINITELKKTKITHERLVSQLRSHGIIHLGQVRRVYFEAGGFFTVIKNTDDSIQSGLTVLPEWDRDFIAEQQLSDTFVCSRCGQRAARNVIADPCPNCQNNGWEQAVVTLK